MSVFLIGGQPLQSQTLDRQKADALARRAAERIRALSAESEQLARQEGTILTELRQLDIDRQLKAQEVARFDAQLLATRAELAAATAEASRLEREVRAGAPAVGERLAALYKMGRPGYLRLLLDVGDLQQVGRAYRTVAAMARIDRDRITGHQRRLASLQTTRAALQRRSQEVARLQAGASAARLALDRAIQTRNSRVNAIDRQRDLNALLAGELEDAQRRLQGAVGALAPAEGAEVGLPIRPFRGVLPWPAHGAVVAPFGRQLASRFGTSIIRNGVEIAASEGEPVGAVHEGRVAFAGPFTGFGNLVILDHGQDNFSLYAHLEAIDVEKGQVVERQRHVGTVGRTPQGRSALYFELRIDGRPVDPLQWLKR